MRRWSQKPIYPDFLRGVLEKENYSTFPYYSINGEVVVDEIIKMEELKLGLQRVAERLCLDFPESLPQMKRSSRADIRPAREILSTEQKQRIYWVCKKELNLLDYAP